MYNPKEDKRFLIVGETREGMTACFVRDNIEGMERGWTFVDEKGHVINKRFSYSYDYKDGYALVALKNGRYTFIDKCGAYILDNETFYGAKDFDKGTAIVKKKGIKDGQKILCLITKNANFLPFKYKNKADEIYKNPEKFLQLTENDFPVKNKKSLIYALQDVVEKSFEDKNDIEWEEYLINFMEAYFDGHLPEGMDYSDMKRIYLDSFEQLSNEKFKELMSTPKQKTSLPTQPGNVPTQPGNN